MTKRSSFGVGLSSMLMIFVMLCLTTFAVLSLTTARADSRLSDRAAAAAEDYYQAQCQAEEWLAEVDAISGRIFTASAEQLPDGTTGWDSASGSLSAAFPAGDGRELCLTVQISVDGTWALLSEMLVSTATWEEETIDVWDGEA